MVERTALKREGNKGLGSDTYRRSESGRKRVTVLLWLVAAGRSWLQLVAAGWLQLHHGDELVILMAVPSSEADDVKVGLRFDGVVKGSRLVVEKR
jgi:hypothetical protein